MPKCGTCHGNGVIFRAKPYNRQDPTCPDCKRSGLDVEGRATRDAILAELEKYADVRPIIKDLERRLDYIQRNGVDPGPKEPKPAT